MRQLRSSIPLLSEWCAVFYGDSDIRVHCHGISKAFHTEFKADDLLDAHGISVDKLTAEMISALK